MSNYLSLIRDKLISSEKQKTSQVVILGLDGSGKSSVVSRLLYGTVSADYPSQVTCYINVKYGKSIISKMFAMNSGALVSVVSWFIMFVRYEENSVSFV